MAGEETITREEAIRRIKAWNLDSDDMKVLAVAIPELAESEDERIREFLIGILSQGTWRKEWPFSPNEVVAYLEKQKERNPINHNLTTWHRDVVYCAMCDKNLDEELRCNLEVVYKTIKELVDRTPVVEEQKPAEWSDEDEQRIAEIEFAVMQMNTQRVDTKDKCLAWLKSLRPHKNSPIMVDADQLLKILPPPSWKPSEEQIDALRASNSYWKGTTNEVPRTDLLESLYNDLEKLIAKR